MILNNSNIPNIIRNIPQEVNTYSVLLFLNCGNVSKKQTSPKSYIVYEH